MAKRRLSAMNGDTIRFSRTQIKWKNDDRRGDEKRKNSIVEVEGRDIESCDVESRCFVFAAQAIIHRFSLALYP